MSNRHKKKFTIKGNSKKGFFRRIAKTSYSNCEITGGLIKGFEPDTIYLRFDKNNNKHPTTFFLRPDEALAIINVLSGSLWTQNIFKNKDKKY